MNSCVIKFKPPKIEINNQLINNIIIEKFQIKPAPHFCSAKLNCYESETAFQTGDNVTITIYDDESNSKVYNFTIYKIENNINLKGSYISIFARDKILKSLKVPIYNFKEAVDQKVITNYFDDLIFSNDYFKRSLNRVSINGKSCSIPTRNDTGQSWTTPELINYLLTEYLSSDFDRNDLAELAECLGEGLASGINATNKSLLDILIEVTKNAEALFYFDHSLNKLIFKTNSKASDSTNAKLQSIGEVFDPAKSNFNNSVKISKVAKDKPGAKFTANYSLFESTFELKPLWTSKSGANLEDHQKSIVENFPPNSDCMRKWGLDETGSIKGEKYNFAALSADFFRNINRNFLPPISTNDSGINYPITVEYKISDSENWRIYPGSILIYSDECSIYLDDDKLPIEYLEAAVESKVKFRITASIESDKKNSSYIKCMNSERVITKKLDNLRSKTVKADSIFSTSNNDNVLVNANIELFNRINSYIPISANSSKLKITKTTIDPNISINQKLIVNSNRLKIASSEIFLVKSITHDFKTFSTIIECE